MGPLRVALQLWPHLFHAPSDPTLLCHLANRVPVASASHWSAFRETWELL